MLDIVVGIPKAISRQIKSGPPEVDATRNPTRFYFIGGGGCIFYLPGDNSIYGK